MNKKQNGLCALHSLKAVQLGCCIKCDSVSAICETKGCLKHHQQSEKLHTSYTINEIQKISSDFISSNVEKRNILKGLVHEYFNLLKTEIESLYHEVEHSLNNLRFQNFLMSAKERELAEKLVSKGYNKLTCSDVALVVPKMIKCSSFEEKQFNHLKDFLYSEKENIAKTVNSMILNLPYFREDQTIVTAEKFTEVSDQLLSRVNKKLEGLTFKPSKLRIKYSTLQMMQVRTKQEKVDFQGIEIESKLPFYHRIKIYQNPLNQ